MRSAGRRSRSPGTVPRGSWYHGWGTGAGRGQGGQLVHVQSSGMHPDEGFPSFADTMQSALCPHEAGPASKLLQAPDLQAVAGKAQALGPPSVSRVRCHSGTGSPVAARSRSGVDQMGSSRSGGCSRFFLQVTLLTSFWAVPKALVSFVLFFRCVRQGCW